MVGELPNFEQEIETPLSNLISDGLDTPNCSMKATSAQKQGDRCDGESTRCALQINICDDLTPVSSHENEAVLFTPITLERIKEKSADSSNEGEMDPDEDTDNSKESDPCNEKEVRWGRKMDKPCFEAIRVMESLGTFSLSEILQMRITKKSTDHPMLQVLAKTLCWKGLIKNLVNRVQSLCRR